MTVSDAKAMLSKYSEEYDTDAALESFDKDFKKARKVLAVFTYNRQEGYKELSFLTDPDLHISYKFYKR